MQHNTLILILMVILHHEFIISMLVGMMGTSMLLKTLLVTHIPTQTVMTLEVGHTGIKVGVWKLVEDTLMGHTIIRLARMIRLAMVTTQTPPLLILNQTGTGQGVLEEQIMEPLLAKAHLHAPLLQEQREVPVVVGRF
jgi:hypothetical protein